MNSGMITSADDDGPSQREQDAYENGYDDALWDAIHFIRTGKKPDGDQNLLWRDFAEALKAGPVQDSGGANASR